MTQQHLDRKKTRGFATITTVLILSIVTVAIITTMLMVSIDISATHLAVRNSMTARHNAESCAEVALSKLKASNTYAGVEILTLSDGTCEILAISGTGNTNRVIQTVGTVNTSVRRIQVNVQTLNPNTVITSWTEVTGF